MQHNCINTLTKWINVKYISVPNSRRMLHTNMRTNVGVRSSTTLHLHAEIFISVARRAAEREEGISAGGPWCGSDSTVTKEQRQDEPRSCQNESVCVCVCVWREELHADASVCDTKTAREGRFSWWRSGTEVGGGACVCVCVCARCSI